MLQSRAVSRRHRCLLGGFAIIATVSLAACGDDDTTTTVGAPGTNTLGSESLTTAAAGSEVTSPSTSASSAVNTVPPTAGATNAPAATSASGSAAATVPPTKAPSAAATTVAPSTTTPAASGTVVQTATSPLGTILTDGSGRTLYLFTNDTGGTSTCSGGCATAWPPVKVTGDIAPASGLDKSLFSTVARSDGGNQLRIANKPLYLFAGDTAPGQTNGQGSGGVWYVVGVDGNAIKPAPSGGTATTTTPVGGGDPYGY